MDKLGPCNLGDWQVVRFLLPHHLHRCAGHAPASLGGRIRMHGKRIAPTAPPSGLLEVSLRQPGQYRANPGMSGLSARTRSQHDHPWPTVPRYAHRPLRTLKLPTLPRGDLSAALDERPAEDKSCVNLLGSYGNGRVTLAPHDTYSG